MVIGKHCRQAIPINWVVPEKIHNPTWAHPTHAHMKEIKNTYILPLQTSITNLRHSLGNSPTALSGWQIFPL